MAVSASSPSSSISRPLRVGDSNAASEDAKSEQGVLAAEDGLELRRGAGVDGEIDGRVGVDQQVWHGLQADDWQLGHEAEAVVRAVDVLPQVPEGEAGADWLRQVCGHEDGAQHDEHPLRPVLPPYRLNPLGGEDAVPSGHAVCTHWTAGKKWGLRDCLHYGTWQFDHF